MPQFVPGPPIETETPSNRGNCHPRQASAALATPISAVVTGDAGNVSTPALVEVVVRDSQKPTAVLDAPRLAEAEQSFEVSGSRSTDTALGRILRYQWMMLS